MEKAVIQKYLLFAFLLENIATQTSLLGAYTEVFFYMFLAIGLLFMISGDVFSSLNRKKFGWIFALMTVYIVYEFGVGAEFITQKTLLYTLAKVVTLGIIVTSVGKNKRFYDSKMIMPLIIFMSFFLVYSILTGQGMDPSDKGRMRVGFTNENTTGSIGALIVGILLFYMKGKKFRLHHWLIITVGCYAVLAAGSRAGFLMLFLLVLMRFGANIKTILFCVAFFVLGAVIFPSIGFHTIGFERLYKTYTGEEGSNREAEREATIWMIEQSPYNGWGFEAKNQGYAENIAELGSHNGYLETCKFMGYPMTIVYFGIIFWTIGSYVCFLRKHRIPLDLYCALVLMLLLKSMYEGLFVGVHEFETNFFLFALAMVSARKYELKQQLKLTKYD